MGNYKGGHGSRSCSLKAFLLFLFGYAFIFALGSFPATVMAEGFEWRFFFLWAGMPGIAWTLFFVYYFFDDGNDGHPNDDVY